MAIYKLDNTKELKDKSLSFINKIRNIVSEPFAFIVIGDMIIDRYNFCKLERKNLEHSSLIYDHIDSSFFYGGATNVANILGEFSNDVSGMVIKFYATVGKKDDFIISRYKLDNPNNFVLATSIDERVERVIPIKTRIIDSVRKDYLCRIDREPNKNEFSGFDSYANKLLFDNIISNHFDAIFISDYNKRFLDENLISSILDNCVDKKVYCNIRPNLINRYKGKFIDLISFNQNEFIKAYEVIFNEKLDFITTQNIRDFKKNVGVKSLIITFGSQGFMYCSNGFVVEIPPIRGLEVGSKNIIGAGDFVASAFAFFNYINSHFFLDSFENDVILNLVNVGAFLKVYTGKYVVPLQLIEDYLLDKLLLV